MSKNKTMRFTTVDQMYEFDELEEYAREGIVYDISTKLNISEYNATIMARSRQCRYKASINYKL